MDHDLFIENSPATEGLHRKRPSQSENERIYDCLFPPKSRKSPPPDRAVFEKTLLEWGHRENRVIPNPEIEALPMVSYRTAEHLVLYNPEKDTAVKILKEKQYGMTIRKEDCEVVKATAQEYFERIILTNQVFGDDIQIKGVILQEDFLDPNIKTPCLVIEQHWREAEDSNNPCPTPPEIAELLQEFGFQPLGRNYAWHRPEDQVTIADARPDNFIKTKEGIFPIDLLISQKS